MAKKNTTDSSDKASARRLQMADIARLAGVSTATVSRALSDSPLISDETKARIGDLAKSLNYSINVGAKNLRLGQNRTIAVVVPYDTPSRQHLTDPFFLGILGSIADALTERGYDMLLTRVDCERLDKSTEPYETGRAVGVILIGQWRHHDQLNELAIRGLPIVVWGAQFERQLYTTVGGDNVKGGYLATKHLLELGKRKIAFLGDVALAEVAQRHEGYRAALEEFGVKYRSELTRHTPFVADDGARATRELVDGKVRFDAIFACSDMLAMAAINTLRGYAIEVPAQVSVVGYDDTILASQFNPPLTTIRQPIDKAGAALVDALLDLIGGGQNKAHVLETELIVRGSAA
ncbi:MAG TPA: LacI family DNA-binding transcriptional regulator [Burkholderiaceae bacterium]